MAKKIKLTKEGLENKAKHQKWFTEKDKKIEQANKTFKDFQTQKEAEVTVYTEYAAKNQEVLAQLALKETQATAAFLPIPASAPPAAPPVQSELLSPDVIKRMFPLLEAFIRWGHVATQDSSNQQVLD